MKISVAMATYNGMAYIEKQLDSIRTQYLLPDEVVICDDMSTDGTADFVEEYIEKYSLFGWRLYRNSENLGFKRNFLSALSKTDGDIIFLCDQDDLWYQSKTEEMSRIMRNNPYILALSSSFDFIDENGEPIFKPVEKNTSNHGLIGLNVNKNALAQISLKTVLHSNISPGCTTVLRSGLKNAFCQNSNSVLPHDWELNIIAASRGGLCFYNNSLSGYRIHSSNALGLNSAVTGRVEIAKEKLKAAEAMCRYGDYSAILNMQKKRTFALENKRFFTMVKLFFSFGEYAKYYSFRERVGDLLFTLR